MALPSSVSNGLLVVALAYRVEPMSHRSQELSALPWWVAALLATGVSAGLHLFGAALNDLLHARRDRLFSPHRPVAAGEVSVTAAAMVSLLGLMGAVAGASFLGRASLMLTLAAALGLMVFNALGRLLPGVGVLALGLAKAGQMLAINPSIGFVWPVWLAMTHVIASTALGHVLRGKRPHLDAVGGWVIVAGWMFWTMALVAWMAMKTDGSASSAGPVAWLGPGAAGTVFVGWTLWMLRRYADPGRERRAAGERYEVGSALWLMVYDVMWVLSLGVAWGG